MGYPLELALRYVASKKRSFISIGTAFAILGVALGVAALAIAMSVSGGFQRQFRDKVLGVNAHVLVLKYSIDFREYRDVMKVAQSVKGVVGVAPFVINPMMVTHRSRTATGVLLKGVDPEQMPNVLDLPKHIVEGKIEGLRRKGGAPTLESDRRFEETAPPSGDGDVAEPEIVPGGPVGSVVPRGGFRSVLPESDALPEEFDPDPCTNPERVAELPGAIIGRSLSAQIAAKIGDCVQITSPTIGISYGANARPPIAKQFRITAIFEAGFDQYDSKLVYADLNEAQAFYEYGDSVTGVEMKVDNIEHAKAIAKEIDQLLANGIYHTMDWMDLNHGLFTALLIQQIGISVVLALIIVVAAFTVIATLIMVVLEKKKEIAVLKAIGARNGAILRVFLYQGAIIGVVGTSLGLLLGYLGCHALASYQLPLDPKVYFISHLPVTLRPFEFCVTGVFAIVICLVATLFPALYAAKLRPADGLRAE